MELLKTTPPASVDAELHGLAPDSGGSPEALRHFMVFLLSQLRTGTNFELVEAYLGLFLKVQTRHGSRQDYYVLCVCSCTLGLCVVTPPWWEWPRSCCKHTLTAGTSCALTSTPAPVCWLTSGVQLCELMNYIPI